MCNLYRLSKPQDEVGIFFTNIVAEMTVASAGNAPEMTYPGRPGLVLADGRLQQMTWGFPFQRTGAKGQPLKPKPVNNARTDKLGSYFWKPSFEKRRCLIPVETFAEAEGPRGGKTRTWFTRPGEPLMAMAGIWRDSNEWGAAYSMIMIDANAKVAPVHNRMPVILEERQWRLWLKGSPQEAFDLCQPYPGELTITRTDEPWVARR